MITLFIDTSLADVSIAIVKDDTILAQINKSIPNEHSIYAVSYVDEVLKESNLEAKDIDNIMVVNGPGSFTGIRIGLTIAKVYAYLLKKDIITVSSLKAMALSVKNNIAIALIDAKHNNYYYGVYDMFDNDVKKEAFGNVNEVITLIKKYEDATIVSREDIKIEDYPIEKVNLDIVNIVKYYKGEPSENVHLVVPNYMKLPQALEEQK